MTIAAEKKLIQQIKDIDNSSSLGPFEAFIPSEISKSGKMEKYTVKIFKNRKGSLKLQWEKNRKPELPKLKPEVTASLQEQTKNPVTFLTSGFNTSRDMDGGMSTPEEVILFIGILKKAGFAIGI